MRAIVTTEPNLKRLETMSISAECKYNHKTIQEGEIKCLKLTYHFLLARKNVVAPVAREAIVPAVIASFPASLD